MSTMVQNFDDKESRNERYDALKVLKSRHLIKFSDVIRSKDGWKTIWSLSWSTENEY